MSKLNQPQYKLLKKGTPFTIIHNNGTEKTVAHKDVTILVLQKTMGQTFFKLAEMTCRTTVALCLLLITGCGETPGFTADKCQDPALRPELKKACYEMEKVCAEVGCSVSVR